MSRKGSTGENVTSYIKWEVFKLLIYKLMDDGRYKDAMFVACGGYMGLRMSDLLLLDWSILIGSNKIRIQETKNKNRKGKNGKAKAPKIRDIEISYELQSIIEKCYEMCPIMNREWGYIFTNKQGGILTDRYMGRRIKTIFAEYEVDYVGNVSSHCLRKTFGRRVYDNAADKGEALTLLMWIFNHRSIADTIKYLGIRADEIQAAYQLD